MKVKLIGQGAYGCVYNPGVDCNSTIQPGYVSKLVLKDNTSKNEYNIGLDIKRNIKNFSRYFIIQEKKCMTTRSNLSTTIFNKNMCKLLHNHDDKYMILMSKYIKSAELHTVLSKYNTSYKVLRLIMCISKRILLLEQANIIHMDMHFANILLSNKSNKLYIIDFGLALNTTYFFINKLPNYEYLKINIFNPTIDWEYWTIEYNLLGYIIKNNVKLSKKVILSCINDYYDNNNKIKYTFPDKYKYTSVAYNYFKRCNKGTKDENVIFLLSMCKSWDYYKLAIHITSIYINNEIPTLSLLRDMLLPDSNRVYGEESILQIKHTLNPRLKLNKINVSITLSASNSLSITNI